MVPSTRCWLPSPPPEFVQWPQFVSMTPGGSTVSTCAAQGVPEPHLVWLKNGKVLSPGDDIRLPPQQQVPEGRVPQLPGPQIHPPIKTLSTCTDQPPRPLRAPHSQQPSALPAPL